MLNKYDFSVNDFENLNQDEYKNRINGSHIFHSMAWMKIIKMSLGINHKIALLKKNNKIVASIPFAYSRNLLKGPCALPLQFSGYYTSIIADNLIEKKKLLSKFYEYCKKHNFFTQIPEIDEIKDFQSFYGYSIYKMKLNKNESLEDQILSRNNKRVRTYTRNAIKSSLTSCTGSLDLLDRFYSLHLQNMKELGTPPFPKNFFSNIFRMLPKLAKIILVMNRNQVCSGVLVLKTSKSELLTLTICTPRLYSTRLSSHRIYFEAAKEAEKSGCSVINFGRSIDGTGPALFKKRFGLDMKPILIYSPDKNWSVADPRKSKFKYVLPLWKKLPIFVTKLGSLFLAKNII